MSQQDYYQILGVSKTATDSEIKKAYRKLAMKYHPDHSKGDKNAEEMFKKVSEAYAVLSDKEKRQQYDTFGSTDFHQRYSQEDIFRNADLGDILKEFGFGGKGMRFSFGGGSPFGGGPFGGHQRRQAPPKGSDLVYELPLTLQEVASGASKTVTFQHQGRNENITVKIPPGMITGKKLRLAGKGEQSGFGGPAGDLFIQSRVVDDPVFTSEEWNLNTTVTIRLSESLLGTQVSIPTVDGGELSLKIPPGTRHKTRMRLAGHGLPKMKGGEKGDLYVTVIVDVPKKLTSEQKKLVGELSATGM
ncbi:DnaJ C-terminal domain-containing protein [Desulfosarcina ovata]|uniref:Integrase n=2 Tax=Desulfosarcina ovata TaxID=83564 RepID=A0A5K8ALP9_9BACT|nr:J domain-containing protein [Desulfosarcina ovata]BBO85705.1 integrase [Desulfosarcina ovata subsp. sediminis]BBO92750.1 integrase [Desulfosarcina ovata subsp. ovata]